MRKLIYVLSIATTLLFVFSINVKAEIIHSGVCGENATWSLEDDGTLTISGTGPMTNYALNGQYTNAPWGEYCRQNNPIINRIVIEDGITSIGDNAFFSVLEHCSSFSELTIPASVERIGESAFVNCSKLTGDLIIPEGVTIIGQSAFSGAYDNDGVGRIELPSTIQIIGAHAITGFFKGDLVIPPSVQSLGAYTNDNGHVGAFIFLPYLSRIINNSTATCHVFQERGYHPNQWYREDDETRTPVAWFTQGTFVNLLNNSIPDNNTDTKEESNENETQNNTSEMPQVPSTVSAGTVQVSIGEKDKNFANIKVLNPFIHDSVNQKILADLYAKGQKRRASIITQKNLIPPYGVKNEWKTQSHTVRWKDLSVKKGDSIIIVWYTPMFGLHAPTLKYIPATVVEDGIIEFTIPAMGDMSVMSIVKLI